MRVKSERLIVSSQIINTSSIYSLLRGAAGKIKFTNRIIETNRWYGMRRLNWRRMTKQGTRNSHVLATASALRISLSSGTCYSSWSCWRVLGSNFYPVCLQRFMLFNKVGIVKDIPSFRKDSFTLDQFFKADYKFFTSHS